MTARSPAAPASSAPTSCTTSSRTPTHTVTVLDKLTYAGNRASLDGPPARTAFTLVEGDIGDAELVDALVADADAVVHFAAESHNDNSLHDPSPFLDTNIIGTFTLLEAVAPARARASTTSPPTRSTATSSSTTRSGSPSTPRTTRRARTPRPRPAATCWCAPGCARSACRRRSATARTTTGPYQHVEKFIPRQITNVHRRRAGPSSTAPGRTCATGSTPTTTPRPC